MPFCCCGAVLFFLYICQYFEYFENVINTNVASMHTICINMYIQNGSDVKNVVCAHKMIWKKVEWFLLISIHMLLLYRGCTELTQTTHFEHHLLLLYTTSFGCYSLLLFTFSFLKVSFCCCFLFE